MLDPPARRSRRSAGSLQAHRGRKGVGWLRSDAKAGIRRVGIPDSAITPAKARHHEGRHHDERDLQPEVREVRIRTVGSRCGPEIEKGLRRTSETPSDQLEHWWAILGLNQ